MSNRIVSAYHLQSINLEDDWFMLECTSHVSPFLSQSIETGDTNCVISMVL